MLQSTSQDPNQGRGKDTLISNGRLIDGTGAPWFEADLRISGGRIEGRTDEESGIGEKAEK